MELSAVTDLLPVQELLHGSVLQHYDIQAEALRTIQGAQYFVWAVLFLIFFSLIFRGQTGVLISWAVDFVRSPARRTYFTISAPVRYGLPLLFLLFLPLGAYLVYGASVIEVSYRLILAVIAGYFIIKAVILAGIAYVSREGEAMTAMARLNALFFILLTLSCSILFVIWIFLPDVPPVVVGTVAQVLSAGLMIFYAVELVRIFFTFREPLLLTILYLCTLEILPIATAVVTVFKY